MAYTVRAYEAKISEFQIRLFARTTQGRQIAYAWIDFRGDFNPMAKGQRSAMWLWVQSGGGRTLISPVSLLLLPKVHHKNPPIWRTVA